MFSAFTHDVEILEHSFTCLSLIATQLSDPQRFQLEKLGTSIRHLCVTLTELSLSCGLVDRNTLHDIRNQLSVVSTRAQLLRAKNAAQLGKDTLDHLEKIIRVCEHINTVVGIAIKRS
jgi:hypothetical protein